MVCADGSEDGDLGGCVSSKVGVSRFIPGYDIRTFTSRLRVAITVTFRVVLVLVSRHCLLSYSLACRCSFYDKVVIRAVTGHNNSLTCGSLFVSRSCCPN